MENILLRGAFNITSARTSRVSHAVMADINYSLPDLADYCKRSFVLSSVVIGTSVHSNVIPFDERVKGSVNDNHTGRTLRACEGGSGSTGSEKNMIFLEIWEDHAELVRVAVPDCKDIYFSGLFGSPVFLSDGESVAFIGENVDAKFPRGFWAVNKDQVNPADKFKFQPDYGETMTRTKAPKLVLFNYIEKEWKTIDIPGFHLAFPTTIPNSSSSLLVIGYRRSSKLQVPGYSVCFNRESSLLRIDNIWNTSEGHVVTNLTSGLYMSLPPAISSCGSTAVFAGHETYFSSHLTELDLFRVDLTASPEPVKVNLERIRNDESLIPTFNGLYFLTQAEASMIRFLPSDNEDRHIVVSSYSSGKGGIFVIDIETGKTLLSIFPPSMQEFSSVNLLECNGNDVVFVHQGYTCPRTVWLASLDPGNHSSVQQYVELFSVPLNKLNCFANTSVEVIQTEHCPAWLLRASKSTDNPARRPLVAYLHGGPHGMAIAGFTVDIARYLLAGYDVVVPNYRGSLSFGKSFLTSLIGNAGILDVADCHDCVMEAKKLLNPSITVVVGGSHGGFLTAWLLGNPDTRNEYAAGVLWNPASDIVAMSLTSDIPEWSLSQVLTEEECLLESPLCPSEQFICKAFKQSPISVVKNVCVPVLVLLGSGDKRVAPSAGLRWAQAVESNGGSVDLLTFPDQGHAIAGPEYNETALVAKCIWVDNIVNRNK